MGSRGEFLVRAAHGGDVDWILQCLPRLDELYGARSRLFDPVHGERVLPQIVRDHCCLVLIHGTEKLGFVFGMVGPHTLNPKLRVLFEVGWWVEECASKRTRGEAAVALVDAFTAWGREHADWILFGLMPARLVGRATLARRGYRESDRTYLLEV